jgi:hypothetical protein
VKVIWTPSDKSEGDSNETGDMKEDYKSDRSDQSLLQHEQTPSQNSYTGGLDAATTTETPQCPSPSNVSEKE